MIRAIGTMDDLCTFETMFRRRAGPSVACSRGCMLMATTGSCCLLGLSLFCGLSVGGDATAPPMADIWSESTQGPSAPWQRLLVTLRFFTHAKQG